MTAVERYAHPRNRALLKTLEKQGVQGRGDAFELDGYQLHTHPDLCEHLQSLNPHAFGGAYGIPVLATDRGVIFALAQGTSYVAFRLPDPEWEAAREAGGFDARDFGEDWFEFEAWRTEKEVLTAWCRKAHAYANKLGK